MNEGPPGAEVGLREVTAETVRGICAPSVAPAQRRFVATNAESIAEAYFTKEAWFRAVYADETPVGFVMLHDDPREPRYYLWRFMVDAEHRGKGYGRRAMGLLVEHVKARPGAAELLLSYVPGEVMMRLRLEGPLEGPEPADVTEVS